jgi:TonB family protein
MEINPCNTTSPTIMIFVKQHIHGIIGATIFALIAILLLLLLGFTTALPLPPEEGILIDFGGGGNLDAGESASATSNEQNASTQNSSNTGVNTQNFEDAASMQSSTVPNPNDNNTNNETNSTSANQLNSNLANLLNVNMSGNGNGTGTSGNGTGNGNPGTGNGTDGSGTGPGGVGGNLGGRGLLKQVNPDNQDNLEGTVKLKITVDENGNVTTISLVSSNCNSCTQLAKDAVKQWKYEKKPGAGYQVGTVSIEFRL